MDKDLENLDDHSCPKIRHLVDEDIWIFPSNSFRHKTTHYSAERKVKLRRISTMQFL